MEDEYAPKSYKLLLLWFIWLFVSPIAFNYLMETVYIDIKSAVVVRLSTLLLTLTLLLLSWIIYKTERIYWFNGVSYNEAKAVTSERRKAYALAHLHVFLKATVILAVYCVIATFLEIHTGIDIAMFATVVIVAAFMTVPIKL